MSHTTPQSYLVWSLLSSLLGVFLVFHLWRFDRFKCLRWSSTSSQSGAFKRLMTYSYLLSVPLIIVYSIGFAVIKYGEGFVELPGLGIVPAPHQLWTESHQRAILPLYLCISLGWALEMVTHLEELCFWLFVVNAGAVQRDWFRSRYFKTWAMGSVIAVLYMPLVTIFTRSDPLRSESCIFLAGSLGSLTLTVWFIPVLWRFPSFLENLEQEGVDMGTIVRLTKFHELNAIRVMFRFLFAAPLLILAIDGIRPHQHVNESLIGTDFLAMTSAFGVVVSSGLTLVIFFPRSIECEIAARRKAKAFKSLTPFTQTAPNPTNTNTLSTTPHDRRASPGYNNGNDRDGRGDREDPYSSRRDLRRSRSSIDKDVARFDDADDTSVRVPATGQLNYHEEVHQRSDHELQPPAFSAVEFPIRTRPGTTDLESGTLPPLKTDFTASSRRQTASTNTRGLGFGRRATMESLRSAWNEGGEREGQDPSMLMPDGGRERRSADGMTVMTADDPFGSPTLTLPSYTFTAPQHSFPTAHLDNPLPSTNWNHSGNVGVHSSSAATANEPPPPNPFNSPSSSIYAGSPLVAASPSNISSPQATIASAVNWNSPSQSSHAHAPPFSHSVSDPQPRITPLKLEPNRRPPEPQSSTMKKKSSVDKLLMLQRKPSASAVRENIEMKESPAGLSRPQGIDRELTMEGERGVSRHGTGTGSGSGSGSRSQSALGSLLLTEGNLERHNTDGSSTTATVVGAGSGIGTTKVQSPLVPNRRKKEEPPTTSRSKVKAKEVRERRERDGGRDEVEVGLRERESVHFVAGFRSPIDMRRGDGNSSDD